MNIYLVIPYFNMQPHIVVAGSPMEAIETVARQFSHLSPNAYDFDVSVIDIDSFTEPTIIV